MKTTRSLRRLVFLGSSIGAHMVLLSLASAMPTKAPSRSSVQQIEFSVITETGGGRLGQDTQIGDATTKVSTPTKIKRTPRRKKPTPRTARIARNVEPRADATNTATGAPTTQPSTAGALSGSAGDNPNDTESGAGKGMRGVDRRSALRAWLREVQREVNKLAQRAYPKSAARMGLEGRLSLGLTIARDGAIKQVRLIRSSGHPMLDESATAAVVRLHVPAPPPELAWQEREISLPVRYAIQ